MDARNRTLQAFWTRFTKLRGRSQEHDAARDWRVVLFTAAIGALIILGFSSFLFFGIQQGEIFVAQSGNGPMLETIDRGVLEQTLLEFTRRASLLEALTTTPPSIVDPSKAR